MISLSACGGHILPANDPAQPDQQPGGWVGVTHVNVDGKIIPCVTWKLGNAGSVSCDFARAK